jgi:hypothetical protein
MVNKGLSQQPEAAGQISRFIFENSLEVKNKMDVAKAGLISLGTGLIATGTQTAQAGNLPAGIISVVAGFGCIALGIWWIEKQVVNKVLDTIKKAKPK